jgi:hypothetical protein
MKNIMWIKQNKKYYLFVDFSEARNIESWKRTLEIYVYQKNKSEKEVGKEPKGR